MGLLYDKSATVSRQCREQGIGRLRKGGGQKIDLISLLHGPSMFAVKAKFMGCSVNNPTLSLLMKHLIIGQR